ncbi:COG4315 family predicted lipoprotein [Diaphorobacter aerolatus]|uniref:ATP-binding protein n=1 Tax=Diaphorobacter aerolatus TaxID=1288495 RepID=A0A7H0GL52_9BURK|nr:hypothetical protein [Diaphorobacter aerolatus]QNP49018.1 hypothetical protein H9K75_02290 [Diaphorobacter aerolatus]
MTRILLAALMASALVACTSNKTSSAPATQAQMQTQSPATVMNGALVGPNQMTLYVFDKDVVGSGKSVCNGNCATNWPPLTAPGAAKAIGDWSPITRDDGSKQWAYKGRPLYNWARDTKPGDRTGEGMLENAWHVARP